MNIALLHQLRAADGAFVALAALGTDLDAVNRDLDELEAFGFVLERHPYHGAAFRAPAPRLCPDQIEWGLTTRHIGRRIAVWNRITSTNDLALHAAESRSNDGLVVLAEEQTAGRGRLGRSWAAPRGSAILMSTLIFPPEFLATPEWLTALGAVAVVQAVERWLGPIVTIKWPNDVQVEGKKLAGILVERTSAAVIGIGLNVNMLTDDFPVPVRARATAMRILQGKLCDRSEIARELIVRLDSLLSTGLEQGPEPLMVSWRNLLAPVAVREGNSGPQPETDLPVS